LGTKAKGPKEGASVASSSGKKKGTNVGATTTANTTTKLPTTTPEEDWACCGQRRNKEDQDRIFLKCFQLQNKPAMVGNLEDNSEDGLRQ
jgi:hypothetical protein